MAVSIGADATGSLLPFSTDRDTTLDTAKVGDQTTQGQSRDYFSSQQQGMQGQVLGGLGGYLSGSTQIPETFGLPQSVRDAAWYDFNRFQMPQLAAQYGAGSPAIGSQMQELQLKLAAMGAQNATQNFQNAYRLAAEYAFKPLGVDKNETAHNQEAIHTTENTHETGFDPGGALQSVLYALANSGGGSTSGAPPFSSSGIP